MLKLLGAIILSTLTLSIAEPPVDNYLPPNSGYPSNFDPSSGRPNDIKPERPSRPMSRHGNQALSSGYSNSQDSFNSQQYSSVSQYQPNPSQYRLNSHSPRPASTYTPQNNDFQNTPISSSFGPPKNQHQNNGNTHNQQQYPTYSLIPARKQSSNPFNQFASPPSPTYEAQPGNHLNPPMGTYNPPNNFGSEHTSQGNSQSCEQKEQIPNTYRPPSSHSMSNQGANPIYQTPSSSYGPPHSSNTPQYQPPSNGYLPPTTQHLNPDIPISFPEYPNSENDQGQSNPPIDSFIPPPPSSSPPSEKPEPIFTEAPPLVGSKNLMISSNSYPILFKNERYSEISQYPAQKSSPIVVPNTYQTVGQKSLPQSEDNFNQRKNYANFNSYKINRGNPGYQSEHRQNKDKEGLTQAPYHDRLRQAPNKDFRSQSIRQEERPSLRDNLPNSREPIEKSAHGQNNGYSYSASNMDNLLQEPATQYSSSGLPNKNNDGYSYEPPTSASGQGQVHDETGYRY